MLSSEADRLASQVREIVDRESIRAIIAKSCRALDRADLELFRSCYHEDAWDDHGYYKGRAADFTPGSIARPPHVKSVMHTLGTSIIDVDGDVAWSECYVIAYQRAISDGSEKDSIFGARYVDRFERRAGIWKIARRTVVYDWNRVEPVGLTVNMPGAIPGTASRDDPSYERRRD